MLKSFQHFKIICLTMEDSFDNLRNPLAIIQEEKKINPLLKNVVNLKNKLEKQLLTPYFC
jgi:hypothetical protein